MAVKRKPNTPSTSHYPQGASLERNGAADRRGDLVHEQCLSKSAKADRKFNGWDPQEGGHGPLHTAVSQYGRIHGFVHGPRGSVSKDLAKAVSRIAAIGAERKWRSMGARSIQEARPVIQNRIRRSIGITAIIAEQQLRSERLGTALGNGRNAAARRAVSKAKFHSWQEEMSHRDSRSWRSFGMRD